MRGPNHVPPCALSACQSLGMHNSLTENRAFSIRSSMFDKSVHAGAGSWQCFASMLRPRVLRKEGGCATSGALLGCQKAADASEANIMPNCGGVQSFAFVAKSVSTDEGRTATTTQQMPGESRLKASIGEGVARAEARMSTLCWAEGLFDIDSGKCFTHSSSQLRFFHASSDMPALAGAWALEIQWQGLMGFYGENFCSSVQVRLHLSEGDHHFICQPAGS